MELHDDGFEHVALKDADGNVVFDEKIDLWEYHNHLVELNKRFKDRPAFEYHGAIVEFLQEKGWPEVSHRLADRIACGVFEQVAKLKNGQPGEGSPASPASTASTPSS